MPLNHRGSSPNRPINAGQPLEVIRAAGTFVGGDDAAQHIEGLWRACSGAAHGDTWAWLSMHDKVTVARDGDVATLQMTAGTHLMTTITMETFTVIDAAHNLYTIRNQPPY